MNGVIGKLRQPRKAPVSSTLNLTALIDLFTILVLFLLFNIAGGGDVLPPAGNLKLPSSISEKEPNPTVTILITRDEISVEGKPVGRVSEVLENPNMNIVELETELKRHAEKAIRLGLAMGTEVFDGRVTLMGDREIPFRLLEKVMFTCSQADYFDIRLAVLQKETI